jgi:hypothetical protein
VARLDGKHCVQCTLAIKEDDLYEVYSLLADATEAASMGDPNECASKAAAAKERVIEIREKAANE